MATGRWEFHPFIIYIYIFYNYKDSVNNPKFEIWGKIIDNFDKFISEDPMFRRRALGGPAFIHYLRPDWIKIICDINYQNFKK